MAETLTPMPITVEPRTMDFPDAIRAIMDGKKVARISWANPDYGFLKDEWLTLFTKNAFYTWSVSQGDLEGNDWIIVNESN